MTRSTIGEQRACKYCNQDIEFHGRIFGWIDRGSGRQCLPFFDKKKDEMIQPTTKHAPNK